MVNSSNSSFNSLWEKSIKTAEVNKTFSKKMVDALQTDYNKLSSKEKELLSQELNDRIKFREEKQKVLEDKNASEDQINKCKESIKRYQRIYSDLEKAPLTDSPENEWEEKSEKETKKVEAKESSEKINKELFVNRDTLAEDIAINRYKNWLDSINDWFPSGEITLRDGKKIKIDEHKDYEFFKSEYKKAISINDQETMKKLDTQFAERLILENPTTDDITKRYYIQINNDISWKNNKTEKELEEEAIRCVEGLTKIWYNVEYIKYKEWNEYENLDENTVKERDVDLIKTNSKYREKLKARLANLKIGETITLIKWGQTAILQKYDENGWIAKHCQIDEISKLIDKDHYVEFDGNKSYISYVLNQDLFWFIDDWIQDKEEKIYHIVRQKEKEIIPDPDPEYKDLDLSAVISDMWTDVHRERISLETEEELKDYYKWLARWRLDKRAYLFLSRWAKRKRMIKEWMDKLSGKAFSGDDSLDDKTINAADRHELELLNKLEDIDKANATVIKNVDVDNLCKDFLLWSVNEDNFKTKFNEIIDADANIQNVLKWKKISHIWTNILEKLKIQKANVDLMNTVNSEFNAYVWDSNNIHIDNINKAIEDYINKFQKTPEFMADYQDFLNNTPWSKEKLEKYLKHQKAIMKMQITNLKVNLDVLTWWKSAYQIDNKDRQKWFWYKIWKALDKLPRWAQTAWFVWISIGTWLLTWWLGTVAAAAITTWVSAWSIGWLNALKKRTHYTKEQNTHEKNIVTDNKAEKEKIAELQNLATTGKRYQRKTYKAKRQLKLYNEATQQDFQITDTVTQNIMAEASKLNWMDNAKLEESLIQWLARLDYYRETWHNFLASEDKEKIESDFNKLEKAIILWLQRLWTDLDTFRQKPECTTLKDTLKEDYDKSFKNFKKERRILAAKYWVSTAALSAWMSVGMQRITWSWLFSDKAVDWVAATNFTNNSTDSFDLWKAELLDTATRNDLYNTWTNILKDPSVIDWSNITINYGAWTDATAVIPWRLTEAVYQSKIDNVITNINALNLDSATKDALIDHVKSQPRQSSRDTSNFMNDYLHGMRCAEAVEQVAKSVADSGRDNITLNLNYDSTMDIVWQSMKEASERVVNANFVVDTPEIAWVTERSRWRFLQFPVFFNTFKDNVELKQEKKPEDEKDKPIDDWQNDWEKPDEDKEIDVDDIDDYKPKPTDPTEDPEWFYGDDLWPSKDLDWKKSIITRWQKIDKIDKSDYGKEYPWTWKLQSEKETAFDILMRKKKLTPEDKSIIQKLQAEWKNHNDIMTYLENKVKKQRLQAKEKAESPKRAFNQILEECYANIPKYLEKILWPDVASKFNKLPDANRIHLVWEYDYLSIAWSWSSGVFRTQAWDIYVSQSAVEQFENAGDIWQIERDGKTVRFPRIYREIKHILTHEMLHSMSVLNYSDFNKWESNNANLISTRRLWFMNINNNKKTLRGRGINEWTTESLAQSILAMRYKDEWLNDYAPAWIAYQKEQKIMDKIIQTDWDNIDLKDFYKVMLIRKYWDEWEIQEATPLLELMRKMNWWKEIASSPRPYYYQLIMSLSDYVNEGNVGNIQFIIDFIEKKDISIIKRNIWSNLDAVFDKSLLNDAKTDFNEEILKKYEPLIG